MTELQHREAAGASVPRPGDLTREQIELVKRTVAQGVNDDELALFLETARRRGLDPFSGQIHAIMRWDARAGREVMKIQTGIDGYRSIANRTGLVEYVEGPQWTADGEVWREVWLEEHPPAAARFTVKRKDRSRPESRVATWVEYRQTKRNGDLTRAWAELGPTMIGKVAEAAALRAAFPDELGGIYTVEEMDQADNADNPPAEQPAEGEGPPVDHAEERRELHARWQAAWRTLDQQARGELWEQIRGRLRGSGSIGDAFAATPLHVLEEIVEQVEDAAGPDDGTPADPVDPEPDPGPEDTPDDEPADVVDVCDGCGAPEGDDHEPGCPVLGGEPPADWPDDEASVPTSPPAPEPEAVDVPTSPPAPEPEAVDPDLGLRELLDRYRHASVVEVRQLVIEGKVTVQGGGQAHELDLSGEELETRVALVDELEELLAADPDGLGRRRRTVDAVLDQHRTGREDPAGSSEGPGVGAGTGATPNAQQATAGADRQPEWADRLRAAYRDALSAAPAGMDAAEHRERWQLAQRWLAARVEIANAYTAGSSNAEEILNRVDGDLTQRVGNLPGGWLHVGLDEARACAAFAEAQRNEVVPF